MEEILHDLVNFCIPPNDYNMRGILNKQCKTSSCTIGPTRTKDPNVKKWA